MSDENNFATELLHEVREQARRWFTAFTLIAFLEVITILAFMWYISLPAEDVTVDTNSGNATYVGNDLNGGLINGEDKSGETYNQE